MITQLNDGNLESFVGKFRILLSLSLTDFFEGNNDYNGFILKEIVDTFNSIIGAISINNGISLTVSGKFKSANDLINELENGGDLDSTTVIALNVLEQKLSQTITTIGNKKFSFFALRNAETHELLNLMLRRETVIRLWRYFYDFAVVLFPELFDSNAIRKEFMDLYHMQHFFRRAVIDQSFDDLYNLKVSEFEFKEYSIDDERKIVTVKKEMSSIEIIRSIAKGEY